MATNTLALRGSDGLNEAPKDPKTERSHPCHTHHKEILLAPGQLPGPAARRR